MPVAPWPRVPLTGSSGALLMITTPTAPAAAAFCCFCANVHDPRGTSTTVPATAVVKSVASQPGVASPAPTADSGPDTVPDGENSSACTSTAVPPTVSASVTVREDTKSKYCRSTS